MTAALSDGSDRNRERKLLSPSGGAFDALWPSNKRRGKITLTSIELEASKS